MGLQIALLVLASAALHPIWNLLLKKNSDPLLSLVFLSATIALCGLIHSLASGADFTAVLNTLPSLTLSICGQVLYGICLAATLSRGDLSVYYPIIRASPVFVVIVSFFLLGKSYELTMLIGIGIVFAGSFLLLYRRGGNILGDPTTLGLAVLAMSGTGIYSLADARSMTMVSPSVLMFTIETTLVPIFAAIWFFRRKSHGKPTIHLRNLTFTNLLLPGIIAYSSYYLILVAYQLGGDVAAVTSVRQASIPISVALGGLFLREGAMLRRFFAAGLLALGIVVIALTG